MNGVIIQFFHWYHEGNLWNEFTERCSYLKSLGFTAVWFPPAAKCVLGKEGRGYDVYDSYDLGEFDQKGGVATRYGTREEYLLAIDRAHELGMSVYADIVMNHRMGGDEMEAVTVHQVKEENRNERIGEPFEAKAFTQFTFPGRNGKYSQFVWNYSCFNGIDCVQKDGEELKGIFKIHNEFGEDWNQTVSREFGNYDYLMGANVEYRNPYVAGEMKKWIEWYLETTQFNTLYLLKPDGKYLDKSRAVLEIAKILGGIYSVFRIGIVLPGALRDLLYDIISRNRMKISSQKCFLPDQNQKKKFIETDPFNSLLQ